MKFSILIDMLFDLLSFRNVTATYFAEKYQISPRTVYRYVDVLAQKIPLQIKRGRSGGISLADNYTLPVNFMNETEYNAAIEALCIAYATTPNERFLDARRKLSSQKKLEKKNLRFHESAEYVWIDDAASRVDTMLTKLHVLQECLREGVLAEIVYIRENGKKIEDKIEPHTLHLKENAWGMYAFSHTLRSFYTFQVGRIYSIRKTEETFRRRPLETEFAPALVIPKTVAVRLECTENALPSLLNWLGIENLRIRNQKYVFDVQLPEVGLAEKLLSYGTAVKVLSPKSLQQAMLNTAKTIAELYS